MRRAAWYAGGFVALSVAAWLGLATVAGDGWGAVAQRNVAEPAGPARDVATEVASSRDRAQTVADVVSGPGGDMPVEPYLDPDAPVAWQPAALPVSVGDYEDPDGPGVAPASDVAHVGEWLDP